MDLAVDDERRREVGLLLKKQAFDAQLILTLNRHGVLDRGVRPGKERDLGGSAAEPLREASVERNTVPLGFSHAPFTERDAPSVRAQPEQRNVGSLLREFRLEKQIDLARKSVV